MNRKQKAAAIAAIKKDGALCGGELINGKVPGCAHAGRCAVGALLFHGGMTNAELKELPSGVDKVFSWTPPLSKRKVWNKAKRILEHRYGLGEAQVIDLICTNDNRIGENSLATWRARARHVLSYIRKM